MIVAIGLPLLIGALGVLQNTLNRQLSNSLGLPLLLLVNSIVLVACSFGFILLLRAFAADSLPPLYRTPASLRSLQVIDVVPGLFGFFIIATAPWAIEKIGATRVFVGIVAAQLLVSLVWDAYMESSPVTLWRAVGCVLALVGVALASIG